jgi:hypothetical protein
MIGNYIKAVAPAVSRSTAELMKTGCTTSSQTGDDGNLQAGRSVSFTVLAENNPFGNTNRFTSTTGNQTYTNNIVIDWSTYNGSTVLGYRRTNNGSAVTWSAAVSGALAVSIAPFTTGWRLPNIKELMNIVNYNFSSNLLQFAPFNLTLSFQFWTSNRLISTGNAYTYRNLDGQFVSSGQFDPSIQYIPCRTFTVTGTTLS